MQYNDGATEATYTYGADNLRASKAVNGTKTEFVWNGQNLASETTDDVTTIYNYDMTGVLGSKKDGETEIRYHKDPHGNVLAAEKNNALTGEYTYDAFGNQLTTAELDNPFRYCGEYFDKESGNIYLRNRYYSTATGRFINEDPIKDGLNWYSYCGGNPANFVDPLGLKYYNEDDCTEEDIMRGMEEDPVAVIETKDYIEIRVKISFAYDDSYSDDLNNMYKEFFIDGVKETWQGDFDYKEVKVNLIDVSAYQGVPSIRVNLYIAEGVSKGYIGEGIDMYASDSRKSAYYSKEAYKKVAGHEFGHVLGIGDTYKNETNANQITMNSNFPSIMGNTWGSVWKEKIQKAQNIDYHMMLRAQDPNSRYYKNKEYIYPGHNRRDLLKAWIPNWEEYIND